MNEVNYNDTVIVPFLEKKCKDLLSLNLVLEAKLLVEQTKIKNFENFKNNESQKTEELLNQIENLKLHISELNQSVNNIQIDKNNIEQDRGNLSNQVAVLQSQVAREQSLKDNAISEYQILNNKYNEAQQRFVDIENMNKNLSDEIEKLKKKLAEPIQRKQQTLVS